VALKLADNVGIEDWINIVGILFPSVNFSIDKQLLLVV